MEQIQRARQIGANVRDERVRQGLTQQQLADVAGVSRGFIARLEKGAATAIYPEKLLDVLHALGLSLFLERPESEQQTDTPASKEKDPHLARFVEEAKAAYRSVDPIDFDSIQEQIADLPPFDELKQQMAATLANLDLIKSSPLFAPRHDRRDKGDDA